VNNIRIIPRLDIKGPNLVKGIHMEGLRVLGKPEEFAKFYYEQGADELMYVDVVASLYGRNSLLDVISKTAKELFIPLTVGGGLKTTDDIRNALRAGADKVSINTAAIKDPEIIKEASLKFGSSTIVVAIEVIKQSNGEYFAFTDNGREDTGLEVFAWAKKVEELGAGELVLTSVDKEGTGTGFDIELIKQVSDAVSIPVIAHGGAGNPGDVASAVNAGASAVAIASILHYGYIANKINSAGPGEGNTEFLKSGKSFSKIEPHSITEIKEYLIKNNISTRITEPQE
jgi:imidazole glycerol-phosphate synthase subunit HisF